MTDYIRCFRIFYASRLILQGAALYLPVRRYEDENLCISLKRTLLSDDTIVIYLKKMDNMRVYEMPLYQIINNEGDPVYFRGHWEKYLLEKLLPTAQQQLRAARKKPETFVEFLYKFGPTEERTKTRTAEIDDAHLFSNNLAQA